MSFIQVTADELRNKASELSGLNSRFRTEIENLVSLKEGLNSMWEGEAKEAFNQAFSRDKGNMDNFRNAIDQYIQALLVIASRYDEAEKRNINTASRGSY